MPGAEVDADGCIAPVVADAPELLRCDCADSTACVLPEPSTGRDFTYESSRMRSSSLTCPWNVGMIGWNPAAIFACGSRIDSRR